MTTQYNLGILQTGGSEETGLEKINKKYFMLLSGSGGANIFKFSFPDLGFWGKQRDRMITTPVNVMMFICVTPFEYNRIS